MSSGVASIDTCDARRAGRQGGQGEPSETGETLRPVMLREVYGRVLRQERTRQSRTLAEVAREAGVSTQYLSEVERGRKEASSEVLSSVCDALGGSLIEFVGGVHRELLGTRARPVALAGLSAA